ncbi:MAG: SpoIVB peptidase S55, partial [Terriglobus sp.]
PICGITPIGNMFQVRDLPSLPSAIATPLSKASAEGSPEIHPIDTPLVFSGFSADTVAKYADNFRNLGLEPVSGIGSAAPDTPQPEPIIPGSAVSAVLARGDLNVAATCTVTYVDDKQLLACGHPMTQYGDVSIPMTKTTVLATLPSPMNAFKIVNSTQTVGSFTQDRANAIAGTFGLSARMIPVAVSITPEAGSGLPAQSLHFEVVDNRQLTPQIMLASIFQSLNQNNTAANQMSLRMVHLQDTFAPSDNQSAAQHATISFAQKFLALFSNDLAQPKITSINLSAIAIPHHQSAELETTRLSTNEAQPGDTIQVEATIRPFQQEARTVTIPVTLPTTLQPGPLRIFVSDGPALDRLLTPPATPAGAVNLGVQDTVAQLNRTHSNDRLYVTLLDHQTQAVTPAAALPSLPPSIANVLQPLRGARHVTFTSETAAEAGSAPVDAQLSGAEVLTIHIR